MIENRDWSMLLWSEKTLVERLQTVIAWIVSSIIVLAMFIGGLLILGECLDGISQYYTEHDQCLKRASNGYEIKQCN